MGSWNMMTQMQDKVREQIAAGHDVDEPVEGISLAELFGDDNLREEERLLWLSFGN